MASLPTLSRTVAREVIVADFIGGPWDGKEYSIPFAPEFRVAMMKEFHWLSKPINNMDEPPKQNYDIAVYKHVLNDIYWFSEIEKSE